MNLQTDLYSFEKFDFFSDLTIEQNKYVHDNVKVTSFKKNLKKYGINKTVNH